MLILIQGFAESSTGESGPFEQIHPGVQQKKIDLKITDVINITKLKIRRGGYFMKRGKNIPCVCFSVNVTIDNCSAGSKKFPNYLSTDLEFPEELANAAMVQGR